MYTALELHSTLGLIGHDPPTELAAETPAAPGLVAQVALSLCADNPTTACTLTSMMSRFGNLKNGVDCCREIGRVGSDRWIAFRRLHRQASLICPR